MERVIVLNNDLSILGTTSWKRAITLISSGKAETVKESDRKIHAQFFMPLVIRLVKAIRNLWKTEVPWSKQNVHLRDGYKCQYCGKALSKNSLTIDHVIPRTQGGKNKWDNTVTSCFSCNNKKDNKTPSQANMFLRRKPFKPTIMEFMLKKIQKEGLSDILKKLGIY